MIWDLDTVKEMLGIDPADTSKDSAIQRVMDFVQTSVEQLLQRKLSKMQDTLKLEFNRNLNILLPRYPVESIDEVDGEAGMPDDWILNEKSGWVTVPWQDLATTLKPTMEILYTGGFDPIPDDLTRTLLEAFNLVWSNSDQDTGLPNPTGGATVVPGSGEVSSVTLADFGTVKFDVASQVSGGQGAVSLVQQQLDWGWLAPWASTLQMYRSEQGVGLGIA